MSVLVAWNEKIASFKGRCVGWVVVELRTDSRRLRRLKQPSTLFGRTLVNYMCQYARAEGQGERRFLNFQI